MNSDQYTLTIDIWTVGHACYMYNSSKISHQQHLRIKNLIFLLDIKLEQNVLNFFISQGYFSFKKKNLFFKWQSCLQRAHRRILHSFMENDIQKKLTYFSMMGTPHFLKKNPQLFYSQRIWIRIGSPCPWLAKKGN